MNDRELSTEAADPYGYCCGRDLRDCWCLRCHICEDVTDDRWDETEGDDE